MLSDFFSNLWTTETGELSEFTKAWLLWVIGAAHFMLLILIIRKFATDILTRLTEIEAKINSK